MAGRAQTGAVAAAQQRSVGLLNAKAALTLTCNCRQTQRNPLLALAR